MQCVFSLNGSHSPHMDQWAHNTQTQRDNTPTQPTLHYDMWTKDPTIGGGPKGPYAGWSAYKSEPTPSIHYYIKFIHRQGFHQWF